MNIGDRARTVLAVVRIVNGGLALVMPAKFACRMTSDRKASTVAYYPYRLFGIRTVLLGLDLFTHNRQPRHRALRQAVIIHGVDTLSAVKAGVDAEVERRFVAATTTISAVNTSLAAIALFREMRSARCTPMASADLRNQAK
jgi:hypothetical protein